MPSLTVEAVGYGAGTMDLPGTPNILRCFLGATANDATGDETVLQVETTIDDMSPQLYEPLIERLFGAGALDVFLQPVIMKRGRPGIVVTALCAPDRGSDLSRALRETPGGPRGDEVFLVDAQDRGRSGAVSKSAESRRMRRKTASRDDSQRRNCRPRGGAPPSPGALHPRGRGPCRDTPRVRYEPV